MPFALRLLLVLITGVGLAGCAAKSAGAPGGMPAAARSDTAAPSAKDIDLSIRRGVDFLLENQNPNGSWGSPTRTTGMDVLAPMPGSHHSFQMACTSLVVMALHELRSDRPEVIAAAQRAEKYIVDNVSRVKRISPEVIYNVWAHAYAIRALVRMHDRAGDESRRRRIRLLIKSQVDLLNHFQMVQGGWGYYEFDYPTRHPGWSAMSFTTGTVLIALREAHEIGMEIPGRIIEGGLRNLRHCRLPDGAFVYRDTGWWRPRHPINRHTGSLGRSQVCHLAMRLWDEPIEDAMLRRWLDLLFNRLGWMDMARKKPIPHESFAANSGYFFYYGLFYASGCIEQLPADQRAPYREKLVAVLLALQEKDGSWWDYPLYNYHQTYGTAYALLCLAAAR